MSAKNSLHFSFESENFATKVFYLFITIELVLIFLDLLIVGSGKVSSLDIQRLFNSARESSLPTWFSSMQFFFVSFILGLISCYKYKQFPQSKSYICWVLSSCIFLLFSIDDASSVHERLGDFIQVEIYGPLSKTILPVFAPILEHYPSWSWDITILPVYALFGLYFIVCLVKELPTKNEKMFFILGIMMYALAVGMDYLEGVEGFLSSLRELTKGIISPSINVSHIFRVAEEAIEMLGTNFILYSSLSYFIFLVEEVKISFKKS